MKSDSESQSPRPLYPGFLVDTEEYRGISRAFEALRGLVTKKLRRDESLQDQWSSEESIRDAVEQLFKNAPKLEMVIAGWADQATLEYHTIVQGDQQCLASMLSELDTYRPDQNGDICFTLADLDYHQVLATTFSFEDETVSATMFQRVVRVI